MKSIAFFQFSTEEDLSFVLEFSGLVLTGRDFEIKITERSSNTTKATLTNGDGITVTGANILEVAYAKAGMTGWARGEYSADVVDITGGGHSRIMAVRFDYNLPGRLVQGVQDRKAYISWSPNQAVVTSTGAIGPTGARGPKGDTGDQGPQGETGPSGTIAVGDVTTGSAGSEASVTNVGTPTAAIFDFEIPEGAQGIQGLTGNKGWSPSFAVVVDGTRRVLQVDDWAGGEGTKPAVGDYVGASGLTPVIGDAVDIRGPAGTATVVNGDKGDITTADDGDTWTLNDEVVDLDKLAPSVYVDQPTAEAGTSENGLLNSLRTKQSIVANGKDALLPGLSSWIASPPTVIQRFQEVVYLTDDRTVDRTGVSDVSAKFIAALQYLNSNGGGKLIVPHGTYTADATIQPGALSAGDIQIVFEAGGVLKAASGLAVPVLDLRAHASAQTNRRIILENPSIDCSLGASSVGVGGDFCTALSTQYFKHVHIINAFLYGGENPDDTHGDAGYASVGDGSVLFEGGRIRGFNDGAFYPNADNSGGATDTFRIHGTHISRCMNAVAAKRDLSLLALSDCTIEECTAGVVGSEITSPTYVAPPRNMQISDTTFRKITANAVRFVGPTKGRVSGCTFEDFGYTSFNGTGSAGANAIALRIQGASGLVVDDNEFRLKDWVLDQQIGVYVDNVTLNSVPFTAGKNRFADNVYSGLATGINEASGVAASTYLNESFNSVTAPVGGFFGTTGSLIVYGDIGGKGLFVRRGNTIAPLTRGLMSSSSATSQTLTAADSGTTHRNDGATALCTRTLPPAVEGLEFSFIVSDADGIRVQTSGSGQFIYLGSSNSTSGGYVQSTTPISTLTLRAINTTIWVATAQTGTWTAT